MIPILTALEQDAMREAGRFNAQLMVFVRERMQEGLCLKTLDEQVQIYTADHGHTPAPLNYGNPPFPAAICTSVNDVICHGIPDDYCLKSGDIVNVDLTTIVNGWHGDSSEMFMIGEVTPKAKRLVECAKKCMELGIRAAKPHQKLKKIAQAVCNHARSQGFSVVHQFCGHGVGQKFHQEPTIPFVPTKLHGEVELKPGMCFTIEPMINEGVPECVIDQEDKWTARTADGKLSAQWEHTILMTHNGPEILTKVSNEVC